AGVGKVNVAIRIDRNGRRLDEAREQRRAGRCARCEGKQLKARRVGDVDCARRVDRDSGRSYSWERDRRLISEDRKLDNAAVPTVDDKEITNGVEGELRGRSQTADRSSGLHAVRRYFDDA